MEAKEEFGSALGEEEAGRAKQNGFFFCLVHSLFFLQLFWEEGDQGALLGSIRSIWDRIWPCLKSPPPLLRQRRSHCHGPWGRM